MTRTNKGSAEALPLSVLRALLLALDAELRKHAKRDTEAREDHEDGNRQRKHAGDRISSAGADAAEKGAPIGGNQWNECRNHDALFLIVITKTTKARPHP